MKTNAAKLLVVFLVTTGSFKMVKAQSFTDPVFKPATTVVDFGEVDSKTDPGFRMLTFTNEGADNLLVTNITPSCGCTTPEWSKDVIKPGKSGSIKVKYDIARIGTFNKTITVVTNEPDGKDANGAVIYKQHVIQVKGNVK